MFSEWLSPEERHRAERFVTAELRSRFVVCRGRLRQWLGEQLGCPPAEVQFGYEQLGKPYLRSPQPTKGMAALHFNVSHSADRGLIALAPCAVGVDIEVVSRRMNLQAIAGQLISPRERPAWESMPAPQRCDQLLRIWVCKEALLKAMGLGIAEGLRKVSLELPIPETGVFVPEHVDPTLQLQLEEDGSCSRNAWMEPGAWRLRWLEEIGQGLAAMASLRQVKEVLVEELD
ncbi:MAG: 4'-phosphopantetheinyl transferase superfamily protein [bacterium]|nr:4'-phosphopantetheinyl transferase superfamily protein [bacterium]